MSEVENDLGAGNEASYPYTDNRVLETWDHFLEVTTQKREARDIILRVGSAKQQEEVREIMRLGQVFLGMILRKGYNDLNAVSFLTRLPTSTLLCLGEGTLGASEIEEIYEPLHKLFGDELPFQAPQNRA